MYRCLTLSHSFCLQYKLFVVGTEPVTQISFSPDDDRIAGVSEGKIAVFKMEQSGGFDTLLLLLTLCHCSLRARLLSS